MNGVSEFVRVAGMWSYYPRPRSRRTIQSARKTGKSRLTTRSTGSQWRSAALVADPSQQNHERYIKNKKEEEKWNSGLIDLAALAQEKRPSDTPCSTFKLEGYGEGPQRAANGRDSWGFFKDAQGLGRLDAGSRAGVARSRAQLP